MFKKYFYNDEETRYSISDDGRVRNDLTGKELKGTKIAHDYQRVTLKVGDKSKGFLVHRLVAETFIPNPEEKEVVDHINGNRNDNRVENLRWATLSENAKNLNNFNEHPFQDIDISGENIEWKPIAVEELKNTYEISNNGAVRRIDTKKILRGQYRNGYVRYNLKGKYYSAHRLVYSTFIGEIPHAYVINHINANKIDNRVENLECVTQSENMYCAQKNSHKGQTKVAQYDLAGNFIKEFPSFTEAAKEMGVTYAAISSAAKRNGTSCGFKWKIV